MSKYALVAQKKAQLATNNEFTIASQMLKAQQNGGNMEQEQEQLDTQRNLLQKNQLYKKVQQAKMFEEDDNIDLTDAEQETEETKKRVPPQININQKKKRLFSVMKNGMYVFQQEDFEEKEEDRVKFMIRVNDPRKTIWDLFIIVVAIYNCFSIPLKIAFDPPILETAPFEAADNIIDILFVVDILVAFRTTFYDMETGDEIFDPRKTGAAYIKDRFAIDFISTVPVDTMAFIFTGQRNPQLQLFSLLKLVRVTRLSRIIARLNVPADIKNSLKLFQLIFMIILYMHCQGCAWYYLVLFDSEWRPALDSPDPDADFYSEDTSLFRKYITSFYSSILLLTSNDLGPVGRLQTTVVTTCVLMGAICNANIFGNMALLISDMNRKNNDFQEMIDTSNTAMKHLKLPTPIHVKIVTYLNYIYQGKDQQRELIDFFKAISPMLKDEVGRYIFAMALRQNPVLQYCKGFNEALIQKISLEVHEPEKSLIKQDDIGGDWFLISRGDVEVFVKDHTLQEKFVRTLFPGMFFGEITILKECPRTASIQSKTYSTIGRVKDLQFIELMCLFPKIRKRLVKNIELYQDRYKNWVKSLINGVSFFSNINFDLMEIVMQRCPQEDFDEETVLFTNGDSMDKIYILLNGEVQTFLSLPDEELTLDTLNEPGCIFGESAFLNQKEAINCNMKVTKQARFIVIKKNMVRELCNKHTEIDQEYRQAEERVLSQGFPILDYKIQYRRQDDEYKPIKLDVRAILANAFNKVCKIKTYKRGRGFHFADLLKYLKRSMLSEDVLRKEKAIEMLDKINDVMKEKSFITLCDPIDRMYVCQERSNFKIAKITNLLYKIKQAKNKKDVPGDISHMSKSQEGNPINIIDDASYERSNSRQYNNMQGQQKTPQASGRNVSSQRNTTSARIKPAKTQKYSNELSELQVDLERVIEKSPTKELVEMGTQMTPKEPQPELQMPLVMPDTKQVSKDRYNYYLANPSIEDLPQVALTQTQTQKHLLEREEKAEVHHEPRKSLTQPSSTKNFANVIGVPTPAEPVLELENEDLMPPMRQMGSPEIFRSEIVPEIKQRSLSPQSQKEQYDRPKDTSDNVLNMLKNDIIYKPDDSEDVSRMLQLHNYKMQPDSVSNVDLKNFEQWHKSTHTQEALQKIRKPVLAMQDSMTDQLQLFTEWRKKEQAQSLKVGNKTQEEVIKEEQKQMMEQVVEPPSDSMTSRRISEMIKAHDTFESQSEIDVGVVLPPK